MAELKNVNSSSITEQCYKYMVDNNIKKLNIYDFLDYIKPQLNLSEEEFVNQMSYFYTDLNLDGRFVCIEDGSWVLKDSLSVEDVLNFVEPSISKFDIEEDIDIYEDEEDNEDVTDELDELVEQEDEDEKEEDDLFGFGDDEEIVSKLGINHEEEEF
ncbi:DNA-directed RNA polymerase subunit delta [Gemelliphila palaticanis]|uniref:RNAP delta factor n=1 Tax=Gemelliphila palaticanis TaxID=81950 RepID=A0ABX2SYZ3_9BACL|nr:DNA-directed RNA polymerase subunit delta [Gemella palaticanis]MBF0715156.1 DNA-directed RNA polymerase subunit delta [Gemella palaticanis]NYS47086.1 DNA-directed RNA polymerase subunit delta [Gemella palaticanis]